MAIKDIEFYSSNGRDVIRGWRYTPLGKPKGIIQIIHGFGEHSRRYIPMIEAFLSAGLVVYADDHIGHGATAMKTDTFGNPGETNSFITYIEDERRLHDLAIADFPDLPFFMFGHSWGSMIARGYAEMFGGDIQGLLLCGLVAQMKGFVTEHANSELNKLVTVDNGLFKDDGEWFNRVFLDMNERVKVPTGGADWLAKDPRVVLDHAQDVYNHMSPTIRLLHDLVELHAYISQSEWARNVPNNIPCYIIAGDEDPCGNYGEGVYNVANLLLNNGQEIVNVKMYHGYRHEIHNEPEIQKDVFNGLISFIEKCLALKLRESVH